MNTSQEKAVTTLRSCLDAAKEAIIVGASGRAIDLCFHALCSYPKSVEAHCLLGEIYRERGLATSAEDTFKRALSADPENLIARWALSLLEEDKGDIEAARWHLLRAFELSPGHEELRSELARLGHPDLSLTRTALGRIYANGDLFDRAAAELGAVLRAEPDRLDVRVAVAEALWRASRWDEAKAACEIALVDSPDCLKANIILAHILASMGQKEKVQKLLDRATQLDPENIVAAQLLDGLSVEPLLEQREVELPHFEAAHKGAETDARSELVSSPVDGDAPAWEQQMRQEHDDGRELLDEEAKENLWRVR